MATLRVTVLLCAAAVVALRAAPPSLFVDREYDGGVGRIAHLAYSSDGRLLAAGGARGFGVWDAQTGNLIRRDAVPASVVRVSLNAPGTLLALGTEDGRVTVIDLRSGTPRELTRHSRTVTALAFTADGRTAASGDGDGNIILWDPDRGAPTPLKDGGHKDDILALGFSGANSLLSASRDLRVVTWDVSGKRALRRATIQSEVAGRTVVPTSAATDGDATRLVVGGQLISQPRGGVLAGRGGLARPEDLRRDNVLMPYVVATGISPDPIRTGDFQPEQVALAPGGCFAFFTSFYRDQPRLHVWGLVEQGDDLLRTDLTARASALALDPGARSAAVAFESGRIQTFRVSGATTSDCDTYTKQSAPTTKGPTITLGSESSPLIKGGTGARIAVLRFEATGLDPGLGDAVAEMVAGELSNNPQVTVVERSAINAIVKEMALQSSGLTAADAVKVGKGLNARKVLFGSVRRFGESTYLTTARVVDVETQQIEGSREVTCENCREQDLPRAVAALRRAIVP